MRRNQFGGWNDLGWSKDTKYHSVEEVKLYDTWYHMLERCYGDHVNKNQTYVGCSCDPDWLYLSRFVRDMKRYSNYNDWLNNDYDLDKDIKIPGNKYYSFDTCLLVPSVVNVRERLNRLGNPIANVRKIQCVMNDGSVLEFDGQELVADYFGVARTTVNNWINGYNKLPLKYGITSIARI